MFYSILFPTREQHDQPRQSDAPQYFKDLNLDQILEPIFKWKKAFGLEDFFYTPFEAPEIILYRQDVMRELEDGELFVRFSDFSKTVYDLGQDMNTIHSSLASRDSWNNNYLTRGKMLDCAQRYCQAVLSLSEGLCALTLHSAGLRGFSDYLRAYCASEAFKGLDTRVMRLHEAFSNLEYCMLIKNGTIRVRKYEGQADHSKQILASFEKFCQGNVKDYRHKAMCEPYAAHVDMMDAFVALGAPAVLVTFLDELASHGPETVSMMSTVRQDDPTERTFKVLRKPPDGLAYAIHIAGKHGLTYKQLCGRLGK